MGVGSRGVVTWSDGRSWGVTDGKRRQGATRYQFPAQQGHAGDGKQPPLVPRSGCSPRLMPGVSAPSEAWRFLQGASPCRVRSSQPPDRVLRMCRRCKNTEQNIQSGHREPWRPQGKAHVPEVWYSLVRACKQTATAFTHRKPTHKHRCGRDAGGSVGVLRAWHAWREASRTWETLEVPAPSREQGSVSDHTKDG